MGTREAFDASLRLVNFTFDAMNVACNTFGEDSVEFARARDRYRIALLKLQADHVSLVADGARARLQNIGDGRRLLVLRDPPEPIAESIFVLSLVRGFASTCEACRNAAQAADLSRPQLVFLDANCHIASKIRAIERVKKHSPQCVTAILSTAPSPFKGWPGVDAIIDSPASAKHILERLCQLVEPSGYAPPMCKRDVSANQDNRLEAG
ncbi:hypothetical protein SAMN05192539_101729 [Paraburkholderia diazotrophica]|uniref:Response regulatory domain-containing protein n=2 Tax=Paraburkholderia diazotrophica TaxID=667676 RepID=A0A1H7B9A4_9BURK|nr:hypothetical protein SAMN05192539_101729 [Paraburkholderia diazotrophica]